MTIKKDVCKFLAWDSEFFGHRIAQAHGDRLNPNRVRDILAWCEENFIECLYFLADSDNLETVRLAERHDFHQVDIRITLENNLRDWCLDNILPDNHHYVRAAVPADIPALKSIAGQVTTQTRFHFDPCFSPESSRRLYEIWIEKSCQGYADFVLVGEINNKIAGYISGHLETDRSAAKIGLVGISADFQGQGVGQELVNRALKWFQNQSIERVNVTTQGRNINAQRLYQRCGFRTLSTKLWYHKWFAACKV